jgi:hypothetical protein
VIIEIFVPLPFYTVTKVLAQSTGSQFLMRTPVGPRIQTCARPLGNLEPGLNRPASGYFRIVLRDRPFRRSISPGSASHPENASAG